MQIPYIRIYHPVMSEHPWYRAYLSLMDITYSITQYTSGAVFAKKQHCLFEMPLFANSLHDKDIQEEARKQNHMNVQALGDLSMYRRLPPDSIQQLYVINLMENELYKRYLPVFERKNCTGEALWAGPADSSMLEDIISGPKQRDVSNVNNDIADGTLGINEIVSVQCGRPYTENGLQMEDILNVGTVQFRKTSHTCSVTTCVTDTSTNQDKFQDGSLSVSHGALEQLLFPTLFPKWDPHQDASTFGTVGIPQSKRYLNHRCHQLFSPYSLTLDYHCMMYQTMKTMQYSNTNTKVCQVLTLFSWV